MTLPFRGCALWSYRHPYHRYAKGDASRLCIPTFHSQGLHPVLMDDALSGLLRAMLLFDGLRPPFVYHALSGLPTRTTDKRRAIPLLYVFRPVRARFCAGFRSTGFIDYRAYTLCWWVTPFQGYRCAALKGHYTQARGIALRSHEVKGYIHSPEGA